jgi:hypothetical protein
MAAVATTGPHVAGITAKSPPGEAARALTVVGEQMTEQLFRYVASEINRTVLETGGLLELGLVFIIALTLFLQNYSRPATILAGVLLLAVFASHFLLTPQLVSQGRILDFRPAETMQAERIRFGQLKIMHTVLVVFRVLCGTAITAIFVNRRSRRRGGKVDGIDNTEDGHIDG